MNIEQQKKLYKEGVWIILYTPIRLGLQHKPSWRIVDNFNCKGDYKLIHKKHTHILETFLEGCEIYFAVIGSSKLIKATDFITNYYEGYTYYVIPKSLKNCYCKASELHYNKFVEYGYKEDIADRLRKSDKFIYAVGNTTITTSLNIYNIEPQINKQIEYNEQIQKWAYCQKEK